MATQDKPKTPEDSPSVDYVPHKAARPLKYVKDGEGQGWLCDKDVDPAGDLKEHGCWRCDEMHFPTGGR